MYVCTFWLATCTWLSFWPVKLLTLGCSLDGTGGTLDLDQHTWKWNCLPPVSHLDIFPHSLGHPWNGSTLYSCQVPKKCEGKKKKNKERKMGAFSSGMYSSSLATETSVDGEMSSRKSIFRSTKGDAASTDFQSAKLSSDFLEGHQYFLCVIYSQWDYTATVFGNNTFFLEIFNHSH